MLSSSMELHPKISLHLHPSKVLSGSVFLKPLKNPTFSVKHKAGNLRFQSLPVLKVSQTATRIKLSASPTEPIISEEGGEEATPNGKERLGVLVKPMEKPRIVLKFIWMEKVIGIGLNQVIPGLGTIPLSPYYFWPKNDAWEQLKLLLESKPWISQNQMHILLSQATDMILLWQEKNARL